MPDSYDAILLDLDGTLLGQDEEVDLRNLAALRRAQDAGKTVMVVTGRSKASAMPVVAPLELGEPVVLFNGCAIWCPDGGRITETVFTLVPHVKM